MEFLILLFIYLFSILIHELGHVIFAWMFSKELPNVRFRKFTVMIIPKSLLTKLEKQWFLAGPIIIGMISFYPFFFIYPNETWIAMVAYLLSMSGDFYMLMKLEVQNE